MAVAVILRETGRVLGGLGRLVEFSYRAARVLVKRAVRYSAGRWGRRRPVVGVVLGSPVALLSVRPCQPKIAETSPAGTWSETLTTP